MKKLKLFAAFLVGTALLSASVFASTPYYGQPKTNIKATANSSYVAVYNYTGASYMVHANYVCYPGYQCSQPTDYPIDRAGSPYSIITYPINFPDYQVCLFIPGVYSGCLSSGNVNIGPYMLSNQSPAVKIVK